MLVTAVSILSLQLVTLLNAGPVNHDSIGDWSWFKSIGVGFGGFDHKMDQKHLKIEL